MFLSCSKTFDGQGRTANTDVPRTRAQKQTIGPVRAADSGSRGDGWDEVEWYRYARFAHAGQLLEVRAVVSAINQSPTCVC